MHCARRAALGLMDARVLCSFVLFAAAASSAHVSEHSCGRLDSLEGKIRLLEELVSEVYCDRSGAGDATSSTGAWCLREASRYDGQPLAEQHYVDSGISRVLSMVFRNHSVLDLGAGSGQYGLSFARAPATGVNYTGVDGALNVERFTNGRVQWADLTTSHCRKVLCQSRQGECSIQGYCLSMQRSPRAAGTCQLDRANTIESICLHMFQRGKRCTTRMRRWKRCQQSRWSTLRPRLGNKCPDHRADTAG